jgi:hypothetical protein
MKSKFGIIVKVLSVTTFLVTTISLVSTVGKTQRSTPLTSASPPAFIFGFNQGAGIGNPTGKPGSFHSKDN